MGKSIFIFLHYVDIYGEKHIYLPTLCGYIYVYIYINTFVKQIYVINNIQRSFF